MVTAADALRLRRAQEGIRVLVVRDLTAMFGSMNLARPEHARDALLAYMPALVRQYGEGAAAVAADWYDEVRASSKAPGTFRALMSVPDDTDAIEGTVRRVAGTLFTESPTDALGGLMAAIPKFALAGARQTVTRSADLDSHASGWQRIARAGACDFCRVLTGRGAVYRKATVHFAAHGDCNCAAVPSWDRDAPEVDVMVYQASARMSGLRRAAANGDRDAQRQVEEHNARIRLAVGLYA